MTTADILSWVAFGSDMLTVVGALAILYLLTKRMNGLARHLASHGDRLDALSARITALNERTPS